METPATGCFISCKQNDSRDSKRAVLRGSRFSGPLDGLLPVRRDSRPSVEHSALFHAGVHRVVRVRVHEEGNWRWLALTS